LELSAQWAHRFQCTQVYKYFAKSFVEKKERTKKKCSYKGVKTFVCDLLKQSMGKSNWQSYSL